MQNGTGNLQLYNNFQATFRRLFNFFQAQRILKTPKRKYDKEYDSWEVDYDSDYDVENYKLETLCDYYKITIANAHRADADALATGDLFLRLVEEKQG